MNEQMISFWFNDGVSVPGIVLTQSTQVNALTHMTAVTLGSTSCDTDMCGLCVGLLFTKKVFPSSPVKDDS